MCKVLKLNCKYHAILFLLNYIYNQKSKEKFFLNTNKVTPGKLLYLKMNLLYNMNSVSMEVRYHIFVVQCCYHYYCKD